MLAYELNNVSLPPTLADMNWVELLELAKRHAIMPLLYSAAKVMSDVPDKVVQTFRSAAIASAMNNERKLAAQDEVLKLLMANDIKCAVLKGSSCAVHYPHPELRQMGDIDILVESRELEKVHELVQTIGYVYQEHQHEFHRGYIKAANQSYIEIHYSISEFPLREKAQLAKRYMENALEHIHVVTICEHSIPVLDDEYQAISLLVHMERHMFVSEIGIRQLLDWLMMISSVNEFNNKLPELYRLFGLTIFARSLNAICAERLNACKAPKEDANKNVIEALLKKIVSGGNLNGSIVSNNCYSFVKNASNESVIKICDPIVKKYIRIINRKVKYEFPELDYKLLHPVFWVFYPIRWYVGLMMKRTKRRNAKDVFLATQNETALYDELQLYE